MDGEVTRGPRATSDVEGAAGPTESIRIFLNYRREDSSGHAGRLYDDLAERYDESGVFIDIDKIEPGLDFVEAIDRALEGCDVVLALIGKQWLTITDGRGERRIDNPDDYVRLELEAALAHGTRVIPVCVQGSEMPSSADLPDSLKGLARRHAIELSDKRWRYDVESLAAVLDRLAHDRAEHERLESEAAERQLRKREAAEREREALVTAERERLRHEAEERERLEREAAERERLEREAAERERLEREAAERQRAEDAAAAERLEREAADRERREREVRKEEAERRRREAAREARPRKVSALDRRRLVGLAALAVFALGAAAVAGFFALRGGGDDGGASPAGSAPAAVARPTISGTARVGRTLTATRGRWQGAPAGFAYRWQRCDADGGRCSGISRARRRTYAVSNRDVGRRLRVVVSATNAGGSVSSASNATRIIGGALVPPKSTRAPVVSGVPREGATLRVTRGAWRGTAPVRTTHVWLRCQSSGSCDEIAGATGLSYVLRTADVRHTIRVVERASNRVGRAAARSAPTPLVSARVLEPDPQPPAPSPPPPPSPPEDCPPVCVP